MNDIVEFLKSYIWENGFEKLTENPFDVYTDMIKRGKGKPCIDSRTARLVLVTMMSKTHEMARNGCSADDIIRFSWIFWRSSEIDISREIPMILRHSSQLFWLE